MPMTVCGLGGTIRRPRLEPPKKCPFKQRLRKRLYLALVPGREEGPFVPPTHPRGSRGATGESVQRLGITAVKWHDWSLRSPRTLGVVELTADCGCVHYEVRCEVTSETFA